MAEASRCLVCESPLGPADGELCVECRELLRWFRSYFADLTGLDLRTITPRTRFVEDLGRDSLDEMNWVLEAESVFGVRISNREAKQMHAVGNYLARLRAEEARWLPMQDIQIEKSRRGGREWKVVTRDDSGRKRPG